MSPFIHLADTWFCWLVDTSWQIAVMIVIVGVLTWLLRNRSPRLQYGLWTLALIKCFLPPSL